MKTAGSKASIRQAATLKFITNLPKRKKRTLELKKSSASAEGEQSVQHFEQRWLQNFERVLRKTYMCKRYGHIFTQTANMYTRDVGTEHGRPFRKQLSQLFQFHRRFEKIPFTCQVIKGECATVHTKSPPSPVILWMELGGKPKWLPLKFRQHDVMHTGLGLTVISRCPRRLSPVPSPPSPQ